MRSAVVVALIAASQLATPSPKPDFSPVRELITTKMGVGTATPSIAVAIARGNEILWEEGFGWIDHPGGSTATPQTLYYVASVSKTITATALMILSERQQARSGSASQSLSEGCEAAEPSVESR